MLYNTEQNSSDNLPFYYCIYIHSILPYNHSKYCININVIRIISYWSSQNSYTSELADHCMLLNNILPLHNICHKCQCRHTNTLTDNMIIIHTNTINSKYYNLIKQYYFMLFIMHTKPQQP